MTKESKGESNGTKELLEMVHIDLCGPMNVQTRGIYEYFASFINDYFI